MIRYVKWTVLEVGAGILLTGIIGTLVLGFLIGFTSKETIGFIVGIAAAMLLLYSMGVSVETSIDTCDLVAARRHSRRSYAVRMLCIILGTFVAAKLDWFNVVTALMAIFSIKIGVYLRPITHRLFCRWFHLKDELGPDALYLPEEDEEEKDDDEEQQDRIDRWMERRYGNR